MRPQQCHGSLLSTGNRGHHNDPCVATLQLARRRLIRPGDPIGQLLYRPITTYCWLIFLDHRQSLLCMLDTRVSRSITNMWQSGDDGSLLVTDDLYLGFPGVAPSLITSSGISGKILCRRARHSQFGVFYGDTPGGRKYAIGILKLTEWAQLPVP